MTFALHGAKGHLGIWLEMPCIPRKKQEKCGEKRVGLRGFEPPRPLRTLEPESSISNNVAMFASY